MNVSGRNFRPRESAPRRWLSDVVHGEALDRHRRGNCVHGEMRRINFDQAPWAWQTTGARRASATPKDGCWSRSRGCAGHRRCRTPSSASNRPPRRVHSSFRNRSAQFRFAWQTTDAPADRREWRARLRLLKPFCICAWKSAAHPTTSQPWSFGADQQGAIGARQQRRNHIA